jgi:glycosyltransferase involved in cell wall biosynthesis
VGGHKELIRDGETGVLFKADSADALATAVMGLFDQQARWSQLRTAGRTFVERERNWARSVAYYRPVFESLAVGAEA